jgi:hypothetical protein
MITRLKEKFIEDFIKVNYRFLHAKTECFLKNVLLLLEIIDQQDERVRAFTEYSKTITWIFFNEADKKWEAKKVEINYTKLI